MWMKLILNMIYFGHFAFNSLFYCDYYAKVIQCSGMNFLSSLPKQKMQTYTEKTSELITKRRIRLHQLSGTDLAKIVGPLTNAETMSLWMINEDWKRAYSNFWGEINKNHLGQLVADS